MTPATRLLGFRNILLTGAGAPVRSFYTKPYQGFNSTLREGNVTHHEYMQVVKGRDASLNQISLFEAKIANGNGEQTLSRDIFRLGHRFDFFRMLSCYYTTIGFYLNVWTVYVFLYGRLYLVLSGLDEALATGRKFVHDTPLQVALASVSFVQLGFLMAMRSSWDSFCSHPLRSLRGSRPCPSSRPGCCLQQRSAHLPYPSLVGTRRTEQPETSRFRAPRQKYLCSESDRVNRFRGRGFIH